jgi:hypothetical protein
MELRKKFEIEKGWYPSTPTDWNDPRYKAEYIEWLELRAGQVDTVVSLRLTLEKEIESFEEARKTAKGKYREAELIYEGIIKGIKNAVNHIIQIEHPSS